LRPVNRATGRAHVARVSLATTALKNENVAEEPPRPYGAGVVMLAVYQQSASFWKGARPESSRGVTGPLAAAPTRPAGGVGQGDKRYLIAPPPRAVRVGFFRLPPQDGARGGRCQCEVLGERSSISCPATRGRLRGGSAARSPRLGPPGAVRARGARPGAPVRASARRRG